MRHIGLHIRITDSILEATEYAQQLQMPIFQCFLVNQTDRAPLHINTMIAQQFRKQAINRRLYVHGSYWINLACLKKNGLIVLKKEIEQTKQLGSQHIILHPGSAIDASCHEDGIEALAQVLNTIMADEKDITFVLENTAHARKSVGSDLADFYELKQKLDYPERLRFCIDTAHAHAYGYDLAQTKKHDEFIDLIDQTIGIHTVELIHLNDAAHCLSSRIDKHAPIGDGTIGIQALKSFVLNPRLYSIPLILELPILPTAQDNAMLQLVRSWHK